MVDLIFVLLMQKHVQQLHNFLCLKVTERLSRLYSEMIFVKGYVHCDPHPGNVLVKNTRHGPQIVLLDHGLYQVCQTFIRHECLITSFWLYCASFLLQKTYLVVSLNLIKFISSLNFHCFLKLWKQRSHVEQGHKNMEGVGAKEVV